MIELVFSWITLLVIAGAAVAALGRDARAAFWLLLGAALSACAAAVSRTVMVGHLPKFGVFETSLATAAVVCLHAAWIGRRAERIVPASIAALVGGALLLHGLFFPTSRLPLTISEQSLWLDLHVIAAWLTAAAFALCAGGAIWILRAGGKPAEALTTRSLQVGFLFSSFLILAGAYYGHRLHGHAFSLDPVELLAVISWLTTASVLHLRAYRGLSGRRLAALSLTAVVVLLLWYRVTPHLAPASTFHIIDVEDRLHG
ncbi:MAG: cytochrome c biogenesis protein CcsA [Deltaproteobacteria bacterium]|nr:cytochrome c biogenesis protein CcsA [Deltaproteobacteria bacterium]